MAEGHVEHSEHSITNVVETAVQPSSKMGDGRENDFLEAPKRRD